MSQHFNLWPMNEDMVCAPIVNTDQTFGVKKMSMEYDSGCFKKEEKNVHSVNTVATMRNTKL